MCGCQGGVRGCQGACMVVGGCMHGCGGMHGCGWCAWLLGGACVGARGHAWLLGGVCGCQGVCVVAGGMHDCEGHVIVGDVYLVVGGCAWLWGVCMVGGMHGCRGVCIGYDEIRSMSGRYASYWNAFLLIFSCGEEPSPGRSTSRDWPPSKSWSIIASTSSSPTSGSSPAPSSKYQIYNRPLV